MNRRSFVKSLGLLLATKRFIKLRQSLPAKSDLKTQTVNNRISIMVGGTEMFLPYYE